MERGSFGDDSLSRLTKGWRRYGGGMFFPRNMYLRGEEAGGACFTIKEDNDDS